VNGPPPVDGDLLRRSDELSTRVVDQDVDPTEPVLRDVDQRGHLIGLSNIRGLGDPRHPETVQDRAGLVERFWAPTA
jgi:hypothetical protein